MISILKKNFIHNNQPRGRRHNKNVLLKISQALQRVTTISHLHTPTEPSTTSIKQNTLVPRVTSNTIQWTKGAEQYKQTKYNLRPRNNKDTSAHHHLSQQVFSKQYSMHVYDTNGRRKTANSLLFGEDYKIWVHSMSNELGRLTQGKKYDVKATDIVCFITKMRYQ